MIAAMLHRNKKDDSFQSIFEIEGVNNKNRIDCNDDLYIITYIRIILFELNKITNS